MPKEEKEFDQIPLKELDGLTLAQVRQKIEEAKTALSTLAAIFPGLELYRYTKEERPSAAVQGSLRNGEKAALFSILGASEISPGSVAHLSNEDEGNDPEKFEPGLLYARIAVAEELRVFAAQAEQVASDLGDVSIRVGIYAKPIVLLAYKALKAPAEVNEKLKAALAIAINFYRGIVQKKPR